MSCECIFNLLEPDVCNTHRCTCGSPCSHPAWFYIVLSSTVLFGIALGYTVFHLKVESVERKVLPAKPYLTVRWLGKTIRIQSFGF